MTPHVHDLYYVLAKIILIHFAMPLFISKNQVKRETFCWISIVTTTTTTLLKGRINVVVNLHIFRTRDSGKTSIHVVSWTMYLWTSCFTMNINNVFFENKMWKTFFNSVEPIQSGIFASERPVLKVKYYICTLNKYRNYNVISTLFDYESNAWWSIFYYYHYLCTY